MDILNKFKDYINDESLVNNGDKILLGVSGGPDSLAMLDLFSRIEGEFDLQLFVFHLNHCFREEAAEEAQFVEHICEEYGIKSFIEEYDVPRLAKEEGLSPEEAARKVRLNFLIERANNLIVDKIALAHHRDDLVETIFLNLIRGSGLNGLSGITPWTKIRDHNIIHPLLSISREEIEEYCQKRELNPRRDPTNQETIYTRNKIRHKVIPYIEKEINPSLKKVMARMSQIIKEEDQYLNDLAKKMINEILIEQDIDYVKLSLTGLRDMVPVMRRRVMRRAVYIVKNNPANLYYKHLTDIDWLISKGETGKLIELPDNVKIKRVYDHIIVKKGDFNYYDDQYLSVLSFPGKLSLPGDLIIETDIFSVKKFDNYDWRKEAEKNHVCLFDCNEVRFPLKVRNRRRGDKFKPLGMKGVKKLKDFYIDEKIPAAEREQIPIIIDSNDLIIWVAGMRMNERVKITGNTQKIGRINLYNRKGD